MVHDILVRPVGEIVFDRTTWVDCIRTSIGGNGANTSYALAKLGAQVRLLSYCGDDPLGHSLIEELSAAGVDVRHIVRAAGEATATTVVLVNDKGARAFLHQPGVSKVAFRAPVNFTPDLTGGISHFHLGNPFGLVEMRSRAASTMENAKRARLTTSLDAGWDSRGEWISVVGPCLPHTDLLFVNEEESRMLTGLADPGMAARSLKQQGAGSVVVKKGAYGCSVCVDEGEFDVPGFAVQPVDSTGAGDCFAGAFLAACGRGLDSRAAARFANAVGALNVSAVGAVAGLLDYEQTMEWMATK